MQYVGVGGGGNNSAKLKISSTLKSVKQKYVILNHMFFISIFTTDLDPNNPTILRYSSMFKVFFNIVFSE